MNEFLKKKTCDRCGKKLVVRTTSMLNTDVICSDCKEYERTLPIYDEAHKAEREEVKKGNLNYQGLYYGKKLFDENGKYLQQ